MIRNLNLFLGTKNNMKSLICNQIFKFHNELEDSEHFSENVKFLKIQKCFNPFFIHGKSLIEVKKEAVFQ